jgi:hypothetical protein
MSIRQVLLLTGFGLFSIRPSAAQELPVNVAAVKALISQWNVAHSRKELETLSYLYSDTVDFYGRLLQRRQCLSITRSALDKDEDFKQTLKNELILSGYSSGVIRCDFVKTVSNNSKVVDYPSYLIVKQFGGRYLIVGESDLVTDRNIGNVPDLGEKIDIKDVTNALLNGAVDEKAEVEGVDLDAAGSDNGTLTQIIVGISFAVGVVGLLIAWGVTRKAKASMKSEYVAIGVQPSEDIKKGLALVRKTRESSALQGSEDIAKPSGHKGKEPQHFSRLKQTPANVKTELPLRTAPAASKGSERTAKESQSPDYLQKGRAFEEFIVHQFALNKSYFTLLDWRSDKFYRGVYPKSSRNPDLVYEFKVGGFIRQFSVECKYRRSPYNGLIQLMDERKYRIYEAYNRNEMRVYVALGIGGKPDSPTELYLIPFEQVRPEMQHHELSQYKSPGMFFYNRDIDRLT